MPDHSKATIDLLLATKAVVERDLGLGLITEDQLRYTIEARKELVKKLRAEGLSQSQIAKATGVSRRTVRDDLGAKRQENGRKAPALLPPPKMSASEERAM